MLLSGVLTKFGGYGMILTFFMLPIFSQYYLLFGVIAGFSAFYAAFVIMTQHDIKRIVAYTTIVEMSIILLGISSLTQFGLEGATFMMLAHGFTIAMLFLAAGSMSFIFAERDIRVLKGVVRDAVSTAYTFLVGIFATTGVPLTAAFVGDVLIFFGAIQAFSIYGALPLIAIILLGSYLYYVANKSIMATKHSSKPVDYIAPNQKLGYFILLLFIFLLGVMPFIILNLFNLSA
jgi:NADH-quinone oxidoreductase subunit M